MRLLVLCLGLALPIGAQPIPMMPLTLEEPIAIKVGSTRATILHFPRKVTGLLGYGLTEGQEPGSYHYAHPKDSALLSLRNLMPGKTADIGVILGRDLILLHVQPDESAPAAIRFLELEQRRTPTKARQVSVAELEAKPLDYRPEKLLELLKLARNERVFQAHLPHMYADVESRETALRYDDGNTASVIRQLYRFPKEDAVVLLAEIENHLDYPIRLDPGSFEVRVGERVYPVVLADAPERLPAKSKVAAHIVVKGDAEGNRAHLSVKNDFRLIVSQYSRYEEHEEWGGYIDATLFSDPSPVPDTVTINVGGNK